MSRTCQHCGQDTCRECASCGESECGHHQFIPVHRPRGCSCDAAEWRNPECIPPVCGNYEGGDSPTDHCEHCEHNRECHEPGARVRSATGSLAETIAEVTARENELRADLEKAVREICNAITPEGVLPIVEITTSAVPSYGGFPRQVRASANVTFRPIQHLERLPSAALKGAPPNT